MLIKISARQVEALNDQALDHLSGVNDFLLAVYAGNQQKAAELGRAFADDLRLLLDVLGLSSARGSRREPSPRGTPT